MPPSGVVTYDESLWTSWSVPGRSSRRIRSIVSRTEPGLQYRPKDSQRCRADEHARKAPGHQPADHPDEQHQQWQLAAAGDQHRLDNVIHSHEHDNAPDGRKNGPASLTLVAQPYYHR